MYCVSKIQVHYRKKVYCLYNCFFSASVLRHQYLCITVVCVPIVMKYSVMCNICIGAQIKHKQTKVYITPLRNFRDINVVLLPLPFHTRIRTITRNTVMHDFMISPFLLPSLFFSLSLSLCLSLSFSTEHIVRSLSSNLLHNFLLRTPHFNPHPHLSFAFFQDKLNGFGKC